MNERFIFSKYYIFPFKEYILLIYRGKYMLNKKLFVLIILLTALISISAVSAADDVTCNKL